MCSRSALRSKLCLLAKLSILLLCLSAVNANELAGQSTCDRYPIALPKLALEGLTEGEAILELYGGEVPGNFGWVSWSGSPSANYLAGSLSNPDSVKDYVNPRDEGDRLLDAGDWISGAPGAVNSSQVRDALLVLVSTNKEIALPVWDLVEGQGSNAEYRIAAFARTIMLEYDLKGSGKIRVQFLGYEEGDDAGDLSGNASFKLASSYHNLALRNDGTLWSWGNNWSGQLGLGHSEEVPIPIQVSGLESLVDASAGESHSLAVDQQGQVWAWGSNRSYQLGITSYGDRQSPEVLDAFGGVEIVDVFAGASHSMAIDAMGFVWTWGKTATSYSSELPRKVELNDNGIASKAVALTSTYDVRAALDAEGRIWTWGRGYALGNGVGGIVSNPVLVETLPVGCEAISGGYGHMLALIDGKVWAWGDNYAGQAGGEESLVLFPRKMLLADGSELSNVVAISAGDFYSLALVSDGSVWAWGDLGALGVEGSVDRSFASKVEFLSNVGEVRIDAIEAGYYHGIACDWNSPLAFSWGEGSRGELGNGAWGDEALPKEMLMPFDTDGDGLPDWWEKLHQAFEPGEDTDGDGLSNADEYTASSNPNVSDTDGDGISDDLEVRYGLNPQIDDAHEDADGDGMSNVDEILNGRDPSVNELKIDTDGDGVADIVEISNGTDPNDYYNGIPPLIEIRYGNGQASKPGSIASIPLVAEISSPHGELLSNAPFSVSVVTEGGGLVLGEQGEFPPVRSMELRTNSAGQTKQEFDGIFLLQPSVETVSRVRFEARGSAVEFELTASTTLKPGILKDFGYRENGDGTATLSWFGYPENSDVVTLQYQSENGEWRSIVTIDPATLPPPDPDTGRYEITLPIGQ